MAAPATNQQNRPLEEYHKLIKNPKDARDLWHATARKDVFRLLDDHPHLLHLEEEYKEAKRRNNRWYVSLPSVRIC